MQKGITVLAILILMSQIAFAQDDQKALEKSLASIDIGLLGSWLTYEKSIGNQLTINTQLGMEGGFFGGTGDFNYIFTPTITVEPRFYYNFNKRVRKGKKTVNNSANYLTLSGTYVPGLFAITNEDVEANTQLNLVPMWGLRRTIGKRVNFEFAVGYGIAFIEQETIGQFGLDLRVGYFFYKK